MKNLLLLFNFRNDIILKKYIPKKVWNLYQNTLYENEIGMEETLQFLYHKSPTENDFEKWLLKYAKSQEVLSENIADVLSESDLDYWNKNGYIVVKQAISEEDCEQTRNAILEYLNTSMENSESWYNNHEAKEGLMVLFTQHAILEKNRASPKIRKAYQQLYKTDKIYKTVDKVSFNPPENATYKFRGSPLHWDVSLHLPIPFRLQGLLYLTDVQENSGAFSCVAGFHHQIEDWLQNVPSNIHPRDLAIKELEAKPVLGNAGDFIIWHQALPHCATPNRSIKPRMVQYLTYLPNEDDVEWREWI